MSKYNIDNRKGFSLIEILVAVLIIGILAAIAFPKYQKAIERSRMAEAVTMVKTISAAQQRYYLATGSYLEEGDDVNKLDIEFPKDSKYFEYKVSYFAAIAAAFRKGSTADPPYIIVSYIFPPHRLLCYGTPVVNPEDPGTTSKIQSELCLELNSMIYE